MSYSRPSAALPPPTDTADKAFDAALKQYPRLPEVQSGRGTLSHQKEDLDAAEACLSHLKAEANIAESSRSSRQGGPTSCSRPSAALHSRLARRR